MIKDTDFTWEDIAGEGTELDFSEFQPDIFDTSTDYGGGFPPRPVKPKRNALRITLAVSCATVLTIGFLLAGVALWHPAQDGFDSSEENTAVAAPTKAMDIATQATEPAGMIRTYGDTIAANGSSLIAIQKDGSVLSNRKELDLSDFDGVISVATGGYYALGLRPDGTVAIATGENFPADMKNEVLQWTDIVAISAGYSHAVGLKSDGTVVAAGENAYGECNVDTWRDVAAIHVNWDYPITYGVKKEGSIVAAGRRETSYFAQWPSVVDFSGGRTQMVGLCSDGSVYGQSIMGEPDLSGWKNIVAIATSYDTVVGLKADGTVLAAGDNSCGQCAVEGWSDIQEVVCLANCTVGIKKDGSLVFAGVWNSDIEDVLRNVRLD